MLATEARGARRREALRLRIRALDPPVVPVVDEPDSPIGRAFERLPPKDREALMLVAVEGLTSAEAAAALGERLETFRSRLTRAKRKLRQALEDIEDEGERALPSDSVKTKETT